MQPTENTTDLEISKSTHRKSDRPRRPSTTRSMEARLSSGAKDGGKGRSSRSSKPRSSGRGRSSHDKGKDSSRKSGTSGPRRKSRSTSRSLDGTVGLSSSEEFSITKLSDADRSSSFDPRRVIESADQDAKRRSRRSVRAAAPGVEHVTEPSTREARKNARHSDGLDDRDSKHRSPRSTRASTPGVEAVAAAISTRESRKNARASVSRTSTPGAQAATAVSTRESRKGARSGIRVSMAGAEPMTGVATRETRKISRSSMVRESSTTSTASPSSNSTPPNLVAHRVEDASQEFEETLSTIRQQEQQKGNVIIMAEAMKETERKKRRRRFCWICLCLVPISIGGGVAASTALKAEDSQPSSIAVDQPEDVFSPSAPNIEYLFDPPSQEDCTKLRLKRPIGARVGTIEKSFDLHFDATLKEEKDNTYWNLEFLAAIQEYLLPSLLGCDDDIGRRSMLRGGPDHRELSTLRYIIGDAVVTGRVSSERSCLPENDSELCSRSIVTLQLFLKADVAIDDLLRLIVGLIENDTFRGVSVANGNRLLQQESQAAVDIPLVTRWALPDTFESVFYILIEELTSGTSTNSDPTLPSPATTEAPSDGGGPTTDEATVSPSVGPTASPTPRPTRRPTLAPAPGVTQEPTIEPTVKPTTVPSTTPSKKPTPSPTSLPTPLPTLVPAPGVTSPPPTVAPVPVATQSPTLAPAPGNLTPPPTLAPAPGATPSPTPAPAPGAMPPPTLAPAPGATPPPTKEPTPLPTPLPAPGATPSPSKAPTPGTSAPTIATASPSLIPTDAPSSTPSFAPTPDPTPGPTPKPSRSPSIQPTPGPTPEPTLAPTVETPMPSVADSFQPSARPVTVLDFDDRTGATGFCLGLPSEILPMQIPNGYKGFQWDSFGVVSIPCATGGAGQSAPNGAGPMSILGNSFGRNMSFQLESGTFDMISVKAFDGKPECPFTLKGYEEGAGSPAYNLDVTPPSSGWFTIDLSSFAGVNKFEYVATCTGPLNIIFDDFKMYMN
ncbi:unnamed protein product [Cylindrotheca closterium]|uniref:Uncharacterized protein n=1 Tax=Cylindrotheca closterium TaxID=2856 RepID=A0AAD2G6N5_9STRA|nr:unnamed protein product [Cylindrotheca closterium]